MRGDSKKRTLLGFTVLELVTAVVVVAILFALSIPAYEQVRARTDKASCLNNLRQLFVAASNYLTDSQSWPQINPSLLSAPNHAYDEAWIEKLMPWGAERSSWICPTIQRYMGGPDYTQPQFYRADYVAMPFDNKRVTPETWPKAPWFVERANVHGNGNLMILSNGSETDLNSIDPVAAAAAANSQ